MLLKVDIKNGDIITSKGVDKEYKNGDYIYHVSGKTTGVSDMNYTCSHWDDDKCSQNVTASPTIYMLCGTYCIICTYKEKFKCIIKDSKKEIYYIIVNDELIVSDDFFNLAKQIGYLEINTIDLSFFLKKKYCRCGRTIFEGVYRIPSGQILTINNQTVCYNNIFDRYHAIDVTYPVFLKALNATLKTIILNSPENENVLFFSGGIDSFVLERMLNQLDNDLHTITIRYQPKLDVNLREIERVKKLVDRLRIENEIIDIDFNDIDLGLLDTSPLLMPFFCIHPIAICFMEAIKCLTTNKININIWSGSYADMLYNFDCSYKNALINRFLLSDIYTLWLNGVKNHNKFFFMKKTVDVFIKTYAWYHGKKYGIKWRNIKVPENMNELIAFYINSESDWISWNQNLSVSFDESLKVKNTYNQKLNPTESTPRFFDFYIAMMLPEGNCMSEEKAGTLFGANIFLPYSHENMVRLFRNLSRGMRFVIHPKYFSYLYAKKEFNISPSFFFDSWQVDNLSKSLNSWSDAVLKSTYFGDYLFKSTRDISDELEFNNSYDLESLMSHFWVKKVCDKLIDNNIEVNIGGRN